MMSTHPGDASFGESSKNAVGWRCILEGSKRVDNWPLSILKLTISTAKVHQVVVTSEVDVQGTLIDMGRKGA